MAKRTEKRLSSRYAGLLTLVAAALLVLFVAMNGTRDFMLALFGWAVCAYIPALCLLGLFLLLGRKPKVGGFRAVIFVMSFVSAVCTLHIWLAKPLIDSGNNYILASFDGYSTVGGAVCAILTSPLVLVTRDFGLSLMLSFIVFAAMLFFAIYPLILKIKDAPSRRKREKKAPAAKITGNPLPKENALFVSDIQDGEPEAPVPAEDAGSRIFEPKEPYERDAKARLFTSLLSPEQAHQRKATDSSRILFGNEEPVKEEKPKLRVLDNKNYFSADVGKPADDRLTRAFGQYDAQSEYRKRYGEPEAAAPRQSDVPQTAAPQKGRELNGYPVPEPGNEEPVSPRFETAPRYVAPAPEPPKPKKIITNPKEYISTPLRPEEYLQMVPADISNYQIPQMPAQSAPVVTPAAPQRPAYAPEYPSAPVRNETALFGQAQPMQTQTAPYPRKTDYQDSPLFRPVEPREPAGTTNFFGGDLSLAPIDVSRPAPRPLPEPMPESVAARSEPAPAPGFVVRTETPLRPVAPIPQPAPPAGSQTKIVQQSLFAPNDAAAPYIKPKKYIVPPLDLLRQYNANGSDFPEDFEIYKTKIEQTLEEFNIPAIVTDAKRGPTFTRYELKLGPGCNIKKVSNLQENLTMRLEVQSIRILTPIAGKDAFGIEIPNKQRDTVGLRSILASQKFMISDSGVQIALGKTLEGEPYVADLASMPHLLVAGATGTGKSVFINQVLISILYKYSPEDVRLILIDPKKVELSVYQGLPNMLIRDTVKEAQHAINMLNYLTKEMDSRYDFLAQHGAVDIDQYNNSIRDRNKEPKMFRIVLVVDEMSDLMMKGRAQVEEPIVRIAQLGRACGIHLILATQRPTVNVITGLIKGNILARVAFAVKTAMDSRIILDEVGAESLLGKGDLIYSFKDLCLRMQGSYIDPEDIRKVCNFVKFNNECVFDEALAEQIKIEPKQPQDLADEAPSASVSSGSDREQDFEQVFRKILKSFILEGRASVSMAQSKHNVGYIRAKRIIDTMADRGYISQGDGAKPREVLITMEEFEDIFPEERN